MADQPSLLGDTPNTISNNSEVHNADIGIVADSETVPNGSSVAAAKDTVVSSEVSYPKSAV